MENDRQAEHCQAADHTSRGGDIRAQAAQAGEDQGQQRCGGSQGRCSRIVTKAMPITEVAGVFVSDICIVVRISVKQGNQDDADGEQQHGREQMPVKGADQENGACVE